MTSKTDKTPEPKPAAPAATPLKTPGVQFGATPSAPGSRLKKK